MRAESPGELGEAEALVTVSAGAQTMTMTLLVTVMPDKARNLPPSKRVTARAGYLGKVKYLSSDLIEGVTLSYRLRGDAEQFALASLLSGQRQAALSLVVTLVGGGEAVATLEVTGDGYGYIPLTATVLLTVVAPLPTQLLVTIMPNNVDTGVQLSSKYGGKKYEKIGGSPELTVSHSGEISIIAPPLDNFTWYHLKVRADSSGIWGGEDILVSLLAAPCPLSASYAAPSYSGLIDAINQSAGIDEICAMILYANVNERNANEATPLHRAAVLGSDSVSLLLAAGAEVDAQNLTGKTPLYQATSGQHYEIVQQLLDAGANPNLPESVLGWTPLHQAAVLGSDSVSLLLAAGAEVDAQNLTGKTPLYQATSGQHYEIVQRLLDADANPNLPESVLGLTPLHQAAVWGSDSVSLLLAAEAEIDAQTHAGITPLYQAINDQRYETVQQLLDAGANPNLPEPAVGLTPLDKAIMRAENSDGRSIIKAVRDAGGLCLTRNDADECGGLYFNPPQKMVTVWTGHTGAAYQATLNVPNGVNMNYDVVSSDGVFTLFAPAEGVVGFGLATDQRQTIAGAQHIVDVRIVSTKTGDGGWTLTLTAAVSIAVVREPLLLCAPENEQCDGLNFYPPKIIAVRKGHIGVAYEATLNAPDGVSVSYQVVSSEGGFTLSAPAGGGVGFGLSTDQRQNVVGARHTVSVRIVSAKTGNGGWTLTLTTAIFMSVAESSLLCEPDIMSNGGQTATELAEAIMNAARNGELDNVCELIRRGAHFKTRHASQSQSPLFAIADERVFSSLRAEKFEIARMLLYNGADPNDVAINIAHPAYNTPTKRARVHGDADLYFLLAGYGGQS